MLPRTPEEVRENRRRTTAYDYQAALESEIRSLWGLLQRYRREGRRSTTMAKMYREWAAGCKAALLTLLEVRRTAQGRG